MFPLGCLLVRKMVTVAIMDKNSLENIISSAIAKYPPKINLI